MQVSWVHLSHHIKIVKDDSEYEYDEYGGTIMQVGPGKKCMELDTGASVSNVWKSELKKLRFNIADVQFLEIKYLWS